MITASIDNSNEYIPQIVGIAKRAVDDEEPLDLGKYQCHSLEITQNGMSVNFIEDPAYVEEVEVEDEEGEDG